MRHEIFNYDHISPSLLLQFLHEYELVFGQDEIFGKIHWSKPGWYLVTWEGAAWVSVLEIHHRVIRVGDKPIHVGGISGVFTLPDQRGKGYSSEAVKKAVQFIQQEIHPLFALLVCKSHLIPLYESLGWQVVDNPLSYQQPTGNASFPKNVKPMIYPFTDQPWRDGLIDMNGLPW